MNERKNARLRAQQAVKTAEEKFVRRRKEMKRSGREGELKNRFNFKC